MATELPVKLYFLLAEEYDALNGILDTDALYGVRRNGKLEWVVSDGAGAPSGSLTVLEIQALIDTALAGAGINLPDPTGHIGEVLGTDGTTYMLVPQTGSGGATTDAALLTSGTLADARLSANIPKKVSGKIPVADIPAIPATGVTEDATHRFATDTEKSTASAHFTSTANPHSVTKAQVGLSNVANVDTTNAANLSTGTLPDARLSSNVPVKVAGKIQSADLPAYVDDVLEFANQAALPATGTAGIIYVTLDTNLAYRWSGSVYQKIADGAVASVAGRTGAITLSKADVGLGSVDNTADSAKPVSTAQATADAAATAAAVSAINADTAFTKAGNSFNGASQLVKMDGTGKLPAVDGSQLINLPTTNAGTLDAVPTNGSTNAVQSNGVYDMFQVPAFALGTGFVQNGTTDVVYQGVTYTIPVYDAVGGSGSGGTTPLDTPVITKGTATSTTQPLSISAIANATSYTWQQSPDNSTWSTIHTGSETSYTATGLTASTLYYYRVQATTTTSGYTASAYGTTSGSTAAAGGGGGTSGAVAYDTVSGTFAEGTGGNAARWGTGPGYGVCTTVAMAGEGTYEIECVGTNSEGLIGLDSGSNLENYTGWDFGCGIIGGNVAFVDHGYYSGLSSAVTDTYKLRLNRVAVSGAPGSFDVLIEKQVNGTGAWTLELNLTPNTKSTGTLYLKASVPSAGHYVTHPIATGLA